MRRGMLATICLLGVAGCGQTDYATQVTEHSARLNATITTLTEGVAAIAWFQYWPASNPSNIEQTPDQNITATGPIRADIGGLDNHTEYRFRLCATEDGSEPVCAQTHRLTTGRDTVQAYGFLERHSELQHYFVRDLDVDLVADPSGPSGPAHVVERFIARPGDFTFTVGSRTAPDFTCFEITGDIAVIGVRNTSDDGEVTTHSFIELVDGGPLGSGQDAIAIHINELPNSEPDQDPSDCSPLDQTTHTLDAGEIVINRAPAPTVWSR